jgi:putative heme iron utilization protein
VSREASEPTAAERCRALGLRATTAALGTLARDPAGYPYASLVAVAIDDEGRPLLLLSKLAEHTQNLLARPEVSVLLTETGPDPADALARGRVTILGTCAVVPADEIPAARATFLAKQPSAVQYVDFADFALYRVEPAALRWVGGFGRMSWVTADQYRAVTLTGR